MENLAHNAICASAQFLSRYKFTNSGYAENSSRDKDIKFVENFIREYYQSLPLGEMRRQLFLQAPHLILYEDKHREAMDLLVNQAQEPDMGY